MNANCHFAVASLLELQSGLVKKIAVAVLLVVVDMGGQTAHTVQVVGGMWVDLLLLWMIVMGKTLSHLSTLKNYSNCWQCIYCQGSSQLCKCSSLQQLV